MTGSWSAASAPLLAGPIPSDGHEFDAVTVSPGLPGFIAMFVIAALLVLVVVDMTRRVRRVQARARVEQRMEAEREGRSSGPEEHGAADAPTEGDQPEEEPGDDEGDAPRESGADGEPRR